MRKAPNSCCLGFALVWTNVFPATGARRPGITDDATAHVPTGHNRGMVEGRSQEEGASSSSRHEALASGKTLTPIHIQPHGSFLFEKVDVQREAQRSSRSGPPDDDEGEESSVPARRPFTLFLTNGKNLRKVTTFSRMDPYVIITFGAGTFWGPTDRAGGKNPQWSHQRDLVWEGEEVVEFEVKEAGTMWDTTIGNATVRLDAILQHSYWSQDVEVVHKGKPAGSIHVAVMWHNTTNGPDNNVSTCNKATVGTCRAFGCKSSRGPTVCVNKRCECNFGFCVAPHDEGSCVAECPVSIGNASAEAEARRVYHKLQPVFYNNVRNLRSKGLRQLGALGLGAIRYVDQIAEHLSEGTDMWADLKSLASRYGYSPNLQNAITSIIGAIGSLLSTGTSKGVSMLGGVILASVMGLTCAVTSIACLSVTAMASLVGAGVSSGASYLISRHFDHRQLEFAYIRANATWALGRIGSCARSYAAAVVLRLADEHRDVRLEALRTLQRFGHAVSPYAAEVALLLNDPEYDIRSMAEIVLATLGTNANRHAASSLAGVVGTGDAVQDTLAIRSLGIMGRPAVEHISVIGSQLNSDSLSVRQAAAESLSRLVRRGHLANADMNLTRVMRSRLNDNSEDGVVRGFLAYTLQDIRGNDSHDEDVFRVFEDFPHDVDPIVRQRLSLSDENFEESYREIKGQYKKLERSHEKLGKELASSQMKLETVQKKLQSENDQLQTSNEGLVAENRKLWTFNKELKSKLQALKSYVQALRSGSTTQNCIFVVLFVPTFVSLCLS